MAVRIIGHESYYPGFGFRPASEYGITTPESQSFFAFMDLPLQEGVFDKAGSEFYQDDVFNHLDRQEADALNNKLAGLVDIDEYIKALIPEIQPLLTAIRKTIRETAPNALHSGRAKTSFILLISKIISAYAPEGEASIFSPSALQNIKPAKELFNSRGTNSLTII